MIIRSSRLAFLLILAGGRVDKPTYVTPLPASSFDHAKIERDYRLRMALLRHYQSEANKSVRAQMLKQHSMSRTNYTR